MASTKPIVFSRESAEITMRALLARSKELMKLLKKSNDMGEEDASKDIKASVLQVNAIVAKLQSSFDIRDEGEEDDK